ncbi:frequency clock protein [Podospora aff. communis PSN243]|uniref:Frequency clock protein n=1 Tax=Podospora aff. communis PSN243 TaxID=3040156 RepID=A0AAV9GAA1_9PEZI|nr:frequency clock protein [Podospora aff. communis PSN243]
MDDARQMPKGTQPPSDDRGHPQPRRTTPDQSVTLQNHRLARDASRKAAPVGAVTQGPVSSPRRNSSEESHDTGQSDARGWFNRSNRNPGATAFEPGPMDVDPPFFQKETDSSNEDLREPQDPAYPFGPGIRQASHLRAVAVTQSSSADDYRSVIDDLTVENKRLKEELKRYKQFGPDMMRKEKLFEIKVHGLPKRKKRELEATLRDFAASLEGSSESPPQRQKAGRHVKGMQSSKGSLSHQNSSSSSRSRPVDSAYASMSTGPSSNAPNSSKASLSRPSLSTQMRKSTEQKVEDYLRDTPGGLFPRNLVMTEKEKKKMVVRRLEQLFTGKLYGMRSDKNPWGATANIKSSSDPALGMLPPQNPEAAREACIQPGDSSRKKPRSRDNMSTSNSGGDRTESGGNGTGSGDGGGSGGRTQLHPSPPSAPLPEQRPTRPKDLDPDRIQVPAENMEYIRHLGLVAPNFVHSEDATGENVSPDADGWVYLNLLCNLAQLHMINVTPNFIRSAVSEKSTKFQLSPDGRRIRWRGGTDGTKFSSDSSGDTSQRSPSTDATDGSNDDGQRKRRRTQATSGVVSTKKSKFGPQASTSSDSFHYKPMFVRKSSSMETSLEGTASHSSEGALEDSNNTGNSKWDYSGGSGSSQLKKRRHDGAIVYYSGAPFCIDLSGDPGDVSPTTYMTSAGQEPPAEEAGRLGIQRTLSGSILPIRPLSDTKAAVSEALGLDLEGTPELMDDDASSICDDLVEFPWCDNPDEAQLHPLEALEACGLGGVLPEDHFVIYVTTCRIFGGANSDSQSRGRRSRSVESAEAVIARLASMSTSSPRPAPSSSSGNSGVEIRYLNGIRKVLRPSPLPPPATFFPPFSTDSESESDGDEYSEDDELSGVDVMSEGLISQRANPHLSEPHLSETSDSREDESDGDVVAGNRPPKDHGSRKPGLPSMGPAVEKRPQNTGSSVATAGGAESGYSSSVEEIEEMDEDDEDD